MNKITEPRLGDFATVVLVVGISDGLSPGVIPAEDLSEENLCREGSRGISTSVRDARIFVVARTPARPEELRGHCRQRQKRY